MAATLVILGSIFGFFAALAAFFIAGVPVVTALLIWILSGPVCALALFRPAARTRADLVAA